MGLLKDLFKSGGTLTSSIPTGEHGEEMKPAPVSLEEFKQNTMGNIKGFRFSLGDEVIDCVTGFRGVVINRCQWLNACNTYGVKCRELKDGQPQDTVQFDQPQLSLIEPKVVPSVRDTGGPERAMSRPG